MNNSVNTVLITGTNRGIGLEFVKQYAENQWRVFAGCRNPNNADALQALAKKYPNITLLPALDVTQMKDIQKLVEALKNQPIDLLIHNAGTYGGRGQTLGDVSVEVMLSTFLTNTVAPLKITEALLPNLQQGRLKVIATISTLMGSIDDNTSGRHYAYRASKAALNMTMKNLAIDLRPQDISVLILHPGWVKTDMGGENAPVEVETSVKGLRKVIADMDIQKTGSFYSYEGLPIKW